MKIAENESEEELNQSADSLSDRGIKSRQARAMDKLNLYEKGWKRMNRHLNRDQGNLMNSESLIER